MSAPRQEPIRRSGEKRPHFGSAGGGKSAGRPGRPGASSGCRKRCREGRPTHRFAARADRSRSGKRRRDRSPPGRAPRASGHGDFRRERFRGGGTAREEDEEAAGEREQDGTREQPEHNAAGDRAQRRGPSPPLRAPRASGATTRASKPRATRRKMSVGLTRSRRDSGRRLSPRAARRMAAPNFAEGEALNR